MKLPEIQAFEERALHEKGFSSYFDQNIRPLLHGIEEQRLEQRKIYQKRKLPGYIGIITVWILLLVGSAAIGVFGEGVFWLCLFLSGGIWAWVSAPLRKYKSHVKTLILPKLASFYGNFSYKEKPQMPTATMKEAGIFPGYDTGRSHTEDRFIGNYKDVNIQLEELNLKKKSGKNTVTTFTGLFIQLGFNKSFKGKTYVMADHGRFGNWWRKKNGTHEQVTLEDPRFEKIFEVYSNDQVEARYILTTAFMERLMQLKLARASGREKGGFNGEGLATMVGGALGGLAYSQFSKQASLGSKGVGSFQCSFINNRLCIALPSGKNLFEPRSINKSILDPEDLHVFLEQMHELFSIIDELKLNQSLGL